MLLLGLILPLHDKNHEIKEWNVTNVTFQQAAVD